ncbi:Hsp33 family molecular chaperone HslO [Marinicrinis lubricantis]|uniref:33 kDa chaperonin n=1 Tax=Marinicrinis lubricantis TaxID=2086470 RepID=A0ABW1IQQ6_9BACL
MNDYILRGTALDGKVRALAAYSKNLVQELRERQDTWSTATAALGRSATIGAMMGAMLKGEERLTIQVRGDGPIGHIVIDANAKGEVRGYVQNPHVQLPTNAIGKIDVRGGVGTEGSIIVIKDLGMKEPYRGNSPIVSGEISDDFTYYFATSEQTPSAVAAGVLVDKDHSVITAGGFIIQLLPGLSDEEISAIEGQLGQLHTITKYLDEGLAIEEVLRMVLPSFVEMERLPLVFKCSCSEERVERTLISLGTDELKQIIAEDGQAEMVCHFCNQKYHFNKSELESIVEKIEMQKK